ncbi:multidrug resistance-associated ABC transporter [Flammula alnicola]|nr:multidrug resistance-associated ABC transporter [Flammula alnicola]
MEAIGDLPDYFTRDSELLIPFEVASFSIVLHALWSIGSRWKRKAKNPEDELASSATNNLEFKTRLDHHIRCLGGRTIFGFMAARLACTFALFNLSAVTLWQCKVHSGQLNWRFISNCHEIYMTIVFLYTAVLAVISLTSTVWSHSASRHINVALLSAFGVYAYRDLWPLATYTQNPVDIAEGGILWAKIIILTITAIVIPLFIPRRYVPIDPKNPMPVPNPEQTASWFARATYMYIDAIILLGYKVPHLRHDQLPPLSDDDYSRYRTSRAFQYIDPLRNDKRQNIFFGLMTYFRRDYVVMALTIPVSSLCSFATPTAINKILSYLETGGANATIRPWFWIALLLIGPLLQSTFVHWFMFIGSRARVRVEGLLTQLAFEHSLRIRLKAETSSESAARGHGRDNDAPARTAASIASTSTQGRVSEGGSLKGKTKVDTTPLDKKHSADSKNQIGKLNNFVTTDLANIVGGIDFLNFVIQIPLQITLSMIFLYQVLGWSAIVGLVTTIIFIPVPGYIGKKVKDIQAIKMKWTDARVQTISEAVNVLRMIKLFGWEKMMSQRVQERRDEELQWLWKMMACPTKIIISLCQKLIAMTGIKTAKQCNGTIRAIIPMLTTLFTFIAYTAVMKQELNASKIFSSMAVFNILGTQFQRISWRVTLVIQAKVSIDRWNDFLYHTELLDSFSDLKGQPTDSPQIEEGNPIDTDLTGFRDATFVWSVEDEGGSLAPSSRQFKLHIDGELLFRRNCVNLIIGPTGSGKTSMLMALLGEMHYIPSNPDSWFNLPRNGGVAYATQESWVQNASIRDNILFGAPYDEERYRNVIRQCALETDLELFEAGDKTESTHNYDTTQRWPKELSQARVTLARAIYSQAKIILLDDILAALDVHTSIWIVNKCLRGDLVKGRTILLVTHNVALAAPIADFIVSIGLDGGVQTQGTDVRLALEHDPVLASEIEQGEEITEVPEDIPRPLKKIPDADAGKLVDAEETVEGRVTWRSMQLFLDALGGDHPVLFFTSWILIVSTSQWVATLQTWFLGFWGSQYETHVPSEVHLSFYLTVLCSIVIFRIFISSITDIYYNLRVLKTTRSIHVQLMDSIFGTTLRWLDETPTARIIARCTQDIRSVDGPIPQTFSEAVQESLTVLTKLCAIVLFTPIFVLPGIVVAILGVFMGNFNARSPLLGHFSAAIHGLVSIRAYGAQEAFKDESLRRIDHYSRAARTSWNLNRWIGLRIDFLGAAFTALLASYLVYFRSISAANSGFSLIQALGFCTYLFYLIRTFNDLENLTDIFSLERIRGYIDIEHEPQPTQSGKPPAAWPTSGDLRVEDLSAQYSQSGPRVLHDLSFHIKSGERIGVVGRTGSGKSSLTLALLRCILTDGTVYYDGIATDSINLDALRSSITIIPQTPELLSATLRQNLDPLEQNDDATLNDALRAAGLFSLHQDSGQARVTLDTKIAGGGSNFSVGERQIIALARAIVRGSKLLILDEATSAIDYETDTLIQETLRQQVDSNVTVITVAHRLQTIMDTDKIMVLDKGRIVEFDSPILLLQKENGRFKALVEDSADKAALYAVAEGV